MSLTRIKIRGTWKAYGIPFKKISEKWLLQVLKGYGRTTATLILGGQVSRIVAKE
jgi:hypothetical protein